MKRSEIPETLLVSKRRLHRSYVWFDPATCQWMTRDGFQGCGIGLCNGRPSIRVYINLQEGDGGTIPDTFEGWPVVRVESGPIVAL